MSGGDWVSELGDFWFGLRPEQWWKADPQLDDLVRRKFLDLWQDKRQLPTEKFVQNEVTALAAVILFDQLPRNMFRGQAEQFATDHLALAIAAEALDRELDEDMSKNERLFLYMPFQHSENMDDQERSLLLFAKLGDSERLRYAKLHHDIIARFGRFPHRNQILGRAARSDEVAAGDVVPW